MEIEKHNFKDKIIIHLDDNEFVLIAFLIERNSKKMIKDKVVESPLSVSMFEKIIKFFDDEA